LRSSGRVPSQIFSFGTEKKYNIYNRIIAQHHERHNISRRALHHSCLRPAMRVVPSFPSPTSFFPTQGHPYCCFRIQSMCAQVLTIVLPVLFRCGCLNHMCFKSSCSITNKEARIFGPELPLRFAVELADSPVVFCSLFFLFAMLDAAPIALTLNATPTKI
jgi:hypothetical protein